MDIDFRQLKRKKSGDNAKKNKTNSDSYMSKELLASLKNSFENINKNSTIYESSLWIESNQNLLANKNRVHTKFYPMKSIVLVDLGVDTFGYEFCYEHPCIVLYNEYKKAFVVPCTSQPARRDKNGDLRPELLEGDVSDGFAKKTTILLNEAKFIDKTRIKGSLGKVGDTLFKRVYDRVFELIFEPKSHRLKTIQRLKDEAEKDLLELQQKYESLEEKLSIIQQDNENLRKELDPEKLISATETAGAD